MAQLNGYVGVLLSQKNPLTGCIPAGIEWVIRFLGIKDVDVVTFQEDFDLQKNGRSENNFRTIASAVNERYPFLKLKIEEFTTGIEKLQRIKDLIEQNMPCLISLNIEPFGGRGWHIIPVISVETDTIGLLWTDERNPRRIVAVPVNDFIRIHDTLPGGKDILFIEKQQN